MYFIHHYLNKGFTLDYLLNLKYSERLFMSASMVVHYEERVPKK